MDIQYVVVYILIAIALGAASSFAYQKWKVFRKNKASSACHSCPSKAGCASATHKEKNSCSH